MTPKRSFKKVVVSVTCSPMNPKRWLLTLECGHEWWITAARRPDRKKHPCDDCALSAAREAPKR